MAHSTEKPVKGPEKGLNRLLDRERFLYFLDLEVKRSRRYQNFFCILIITINGLSTSEDGKGLQKCYQRLIHCVFEELRDSDILGEIGERKLAVLLPYADISDGIHAKARFEKCLQYYDFKREGYAVSIDQIGFPGDGTDTTDLIRKAVGVESLGSPNNFK
jgi:GGDEF domain-containing protein